MLTDDNSLPFELSDYEESECGKPCSPDNPCDECAGYWQRMIEQGLWIPGKGWSEHAFETII